MFIELIPEFPTGLRQNLVITALCKTPFSFSNSHSSALEILWVIENKNLELRLKEWEKRLVLQRKEF
jgi:hypothetical protein